MQAQGQAERSAVGRCEARLGRRSWPHRARLAVIRRPSRSGCEQRRWRVAVHRRSLRARRAYPPIPRLVGLARQDATDQAPVDGQHNPSRRRRLAHENRSRLGGTAAQRPSRIRLGPRCATGGRRRRYPRSREPCGLRAASWVRRPVRRGRGRLHRPGGWRDRLFSRKAIARSAPARTALSSDAIAGVATRRTIAYSCCKAAVGSRHQTAGCCLRLLPALRPAGRFTSPCFCARSGALWHSPPGSAKGDRGNASHRWRASTTPVPSREPSISGVAGIVGFAPGHACTQFRSRVDAQLAVRASELCFNGLRADEEHRGHSGVGVTGGSESCYPLFCRSQVFAESRVPGPGRPTRPKPARPTAGCRRVRRSPAPRPTRPWPRGVACAVGGCVPAPEGCALVQSASAAARGLPRRALRPPQRRQGLRLLRGAGHGNARRRRSPRCDRAPSAGLEPLHDDFRLRRAPCRDQSLGCVAGQEDSSSGRL